jgi:hypothetical protein
MKICHIKKTIVIGVTIIFAFGLCNAQKREIFYKDYIYSDDIKTVMLHKKGWELSYPVMELNSRDVLQLSFDELGTDPNTYYYTIIHCSSDWEPSNLMENDYIEGFTESNIKNYSLSFNTTYDYVHYTLDLPNEELAPKISGDYILLVYENFNRDNPVLTRKFFVLEKKVEVNAEVKRPKAGKLRDKGHEIDFKIQYSGYQIRDPYADIKVTLMQNYRNDNMITDLKPLFITNTELDYSYDNENTFMAGREFRYFDIKSTRYQAEFIDSVRFQVPYYHVYVSPLDNRSNKPYYFVNDLNGRFYIDVQEGRDRHVDADYLYVHFTMPVDAPVIEGNVYLLGALTDWNFGKENEMIYNYDKRQYELDLLLKQGYYNFLAAYLPKKRFKADLSYFEGNFYETENDYSIFVYHSDFASRYERLIGYLKINTINK